MENKNKKYSTILIGELGTLLIQCGEILLQHGYSIKCVISPTNSILKWADEQKIPHYESI